MRMTGDKQSWWIGIYFVKHLLVISTGITSDMRDPNIHFFAQKPIVEWKHLSDFCTVNISINSPQWFDTFQLFHHLHCSNISGMPYFIAVFKMMENSFGYMSVCVGNQTYFFQTFLFVRK